MNFKDGTEVLLKTSEKATDFCFNDAVFDD